MVLSEGVMFQILFINTYSIPYCSTLIAKECTEKVINCSLSETKKVFTSVCSEIFLDITEICFHFSFDLFILNFEYIFSYCISEKRRTLYSGRKIVITFAFTRIHNKILSIFVCSQYMFFRQTNSEVIS